MAKQFIEAKDLTKYYGKHRGVLGLTFNVHEGEIFGYLGPNGAGKTTTIRIFLDLIRPTSGSVKIFGKDPRHQGIEVRKNVGYLPGELSLYQDLTGRNTLKFLSNLRGGLDWNYIDELADLFELNLDRKVSELSSGNKQKLGLIQAFMAKPKLLILDEPTRGLDPLLQQEFFHLVEEAKETGQTVFLSSHILPVVERICDRVGIIRKGELAAVEDVDDLKASALRSLEIHFADPPPKDAFENISAVQEVTFEDSIVRCRVVGELDELIKQAAKYEVVNVISHEPDLEEIFLQYYAGERRAEEGNVKKRAG